MLIVRMFFSERFATDCADAHFRCDSALHWGRTLWTQIRGQLCHSCWS